MFSFDQIYDTLQFLNIASMGCMKSRNSSQGRIDHLPNNNNHNQAPPFEQSKQLQKDSVMVIHCKLLTGNQQIVEIDKNATVLMLQQKLSERMGVEVTRLKILEKHSNKQCKKNARLSEYDIQNGSTVHVIIKLDIGVFDDHQYSSYREHLIDKSIKATNEQVTDLISGLQGNQNAQFHLTHSGIPKQTLQNLIDYSDQEYQAMSERAQSVKEEMDDLKIKLSREELVRLMGGGHVSEIQEIFGDSYSQIILRRCQAHGKFINFHTDVALKTLQLSLNCDSEYEGGRLVYAMKGSLQSPKRSAGSITIHNNKIVHGVSLLESGVRYGLFLLKKQAPI